MPPDTLIKPYCKPVLGKMSIGTVQIYVFIEAIFIYNYTFGKLAVFERMMKRAGLE